MAMNANAFNYVLPQTGTVHFITHRVTKLLSLETGELGYGGLMCIIIIYGPVAIFFTVYKNKNDIFPLVFDLLLQLLLHLIAAEACLHVDV